MFRAAGELDAVYVGVGMGSGICGLIAVRDLLGLKTAIAPEETFDMSFLPKAGGQK